MNLLLSVSAESISTKKEGNWITQFKERSIPLEQAVLEELFSSKVYSANIWEKGNPSNANFQKMTAVVLDSDDGKLTLAQAKKQFKLYTYVIHTSTNHRQDVPDHNGVQDRFRIILPIDDEDIAKVTSGDLAGNVYEYILENNLFADKSCADPARKYFPFCRKDNNDQNNFKVFINEGLLYKLDFARIKESASRRASTKTKAAGDIDVPDQIIKWDTQVVLTDGKTIVKIKDIKEKTACYCIFCPDLTSTTPSAFVNFHPTKGTPFLRCTHCGKTWWLDVTERYPELFQVEDRLMVIRKTKNNVIITKTTEAYYNDLNAEETKKFRHWLAHTTSSSELFSIEKYTAPDLDEAEYVLDREGGLVRIYIPLLPVKNKNNKLVNAWFDSYGKQHGEFLKNFVMLFCYANYIRTPTVIMTGERGGGKTTFYEILGGLFRGMSKQWEISDTQFNEHLDTKLIAIDEAQINRAEQYATLKYLAGNETIPINKKYGAKFVVRNNLMVMIMTNNDIPLYMESSETPADDKVNQFYVMKVRPLSKINTNIKQELWDAFPHYVRTELKERWLQWQKIPNKSEYRFGISVPITKSLTKIYQISKHDISTEAEKIYDALLKGLVVKDPKTQEPVFTFGPFEYANSNTIKDAIRYTNAIALPQTRWDTYRKEMQRMGHISFTETKDKGYMVFPFATPFADEEDYDEEGNEADEE